MCILTQTLVYHNLFCFKSDDTMTHTNIHGSMQLGEKYQFLISGNIDNDITK